jgi:hypothetical protein
MRKEDIRRFTSYLGKRSYKARVARLGIERIREIARENGKKGGRPKKKKNTEKPEEIGYTLSQNTD